MSENDERNAIIESMSNVFGIDLNKVSIKTEYGLIYLYLNEENAKKYIFHFGINPLQIVIFIDKYFNYHYPKLTELNKESAQSIVKNLREKFGIVDKDIFIYAYPTEGCDDRLAINRVKKFKKRKKSVF